MSNSNYSIGLQRLNPVHTAYCGLHNSAENWSWARDVNGRDRNETETSASRDRDETETLTIFLETRPRRDVGTSRDRLETETSRPRPQPCVYFYLCKMFTTAPPLECTILREKIIPMASGLLLLRYHGGEIDDVFFPSGECTHVCYSAFTPESNTYGADISAVHSTSTQHSVRTITISVWRAVM